MNNEQCSSPCSPWFYIHRESFMFAVIMAGGSGARVLPGSRENLPKQFLKITSDRTMLEETVRRVEHFAAPDRMLTVVGRAHTDITSRLLEGTAVKGLA